MVTRRKPSAEAGEGDDEGNDNQYVGSVARALSVLTAFRAEDGPLGNAELAERTQLTKPTVSRLTYTLARCGFLSFNQRYRVYELGPSVQALGNIATAAMDVRRLARPLMRELANHANFNVGLGMRDQHMMVYTDACEGEGLVGLRLFAGSRIPIVTSAMGRAYLAGLEPEEREALLLELRPSYGDDWPTLLKAVQNSVREVAQNGFCVSVGEWQKDINGVAAPIRSPDGGRVYAINLGGPSYLLPESALRGELGARIAQVARKVATSMAPKLHPVQTSVDAARDVTQKKAKR
ncbi:MAG: IclR family transcriptional regulator [Desulfobacterales bacterium]|nr:IclR family transcriptional regulator [Desulfobacterales bacterium]